MNPIPPISPLDATRLAGVVDRQIQRVGMIANLVRSSGARECRIFFGNWSARELYGGLIDPLDRLVIMSAVGLTVPPDHVQDHLVTGTLGALGAQNLRILQAPERIAPGDTVICWKLRVRR